MKKFLISLLILVSAYILLPVNSYAFSSVNEFKWSWTYNGSPYYRYYYVAIDIPDSYDVRIFKDNNLGTYNFGIFNGTSLVPGSYLLTTKNTDPGNDSTWYNYSSSVSNTTTGYFSFTFTNPSGSPSFFYYPSLEDARYKNGAPVESAFDDNIGIELNLSLIQSFAILGTDQLPSWRLKWYPGSVTGNYSFDSVHVHLQGDLGSDDFDFSEINSEYWFDPHVYASDGNPVGIFVTPYLDGDYGNSKYISKVYSPSILLSVTTKFHDFVKQFTNSDGPGTIVGVDDTEVQTVKVEDRDYNHRSPTTIPSTSSYSPVFQNTSNSVVNNYLTTNNVVTNNYYNTYNYITNTTQYVSTGGQGESNQQKYDKAISFLNSNVDVVGSSLDKLNGTPFKPIAAALITGIGIIAAIVVIMLIAKLVGSILDIIF